MRRLLFWFGIISFALFACGCTINGNSECCAGNVLVKENTLDTGNIKIGEPINCVQLLERKMKYSNEHFKYIVTIYGVVKKIEPPEVYIKIENISVENLKKENTTWIKDQSVAKKPPYTIGKTYVFRAKHDFIDDIVSTGVHKIYFLQP